MSFAPTHRHVKTGEVYQVIHQRDTVFIEKERQPAVLYQDAAGVIWARPADEFHDGRFEKYTKPTIPMPESIKPRDVIEQLFALERARHDIHDKTDITLNFTLHFVAMYIVTLDVLYSLRILEDDEPFAVDGSHVLEGFCNAGVCKKSVGQLHDTVEQVWQTLTSTRPSLMARQREYIYARLLERYGVPPVVIGGSNP